MKTTLLSFLILLTVLAPVLVMADSSLGNSGEIVLTITGFENSKGITKVALVNSKENYSEDKPYKGFNFEIIDNKVVQTISNLPYGEYAIKIYHDENSNNELDTRIFGIPAERYGFSNNARGSFGPPDYEEAAFKVSASTTQVEIEVK